MCDVDCRQFIGNMLMVGGYGIAIICFSFGYGTRKND